MTHEKPKNLREFMKNYFVEHRPEVTRRGTICLRPLHGLENNYFGFRSVYCFPEAVKNLIETKNSTSGLRGAVVMSEKLLVDFDDCPVEALKLIKYLVDQDIIFEVWDSGNRSVHLHIPFETPMIGSWVPQAQKQWVQKHAPRADTSFYHTAGMYRLPGTFHVKNPGHFKRLMKTSPGTRYLEIPKPNLVTPVKYNISDDVAKWQMFGQFLTVPNYRISRDQMAYQIIKTGQELGFSEDKILGWVKFWNSHRVNPPLEEHVLENKVRYIYEC